MPSPSCQCASLALVCAVHAALAVAILASLYQRDAGALTVTTRHQFGDWHPLMQLYRDTASLANESDPLGQGWPTGEAMRAAALERAWCVFPRQPGAGEPPFCRCVSEAHDEFLNATRAVAQAIPVALREDAARRLLRCLNVRPVWRVEPVWGVSVASAALYVLVVASCFAWLALDARFPLARAPMWLFVVGVGSAALLHSAGENLLWIFSIVLLVLLVEKVLVPGLAPLEREGRASRVLDRLPSCFWWCEYLSAPFFALLVPLMHCGRDLYFLALAFVLGGAVGGLGLRSYWCSQVCTRGDAARDMWRLAGAGLSVAVLTLFLLSAAYYDAGDGVFRLSWASLVCLTLTCAIGLFESPFQLPVPPGVRLAGQGLLAMVRNVLFAWAALSDMAL